MLLRNVNILVAFIILIFIIFIAIIFDIIIVAVNAATTIGGKALGKSYVMNESKKIIDKVSRIVYIIKKDR